VIRLRYPDYCGSNFERPGPVDHASELLLPNTNCNIHYGKCKNKTCFIHGHKERHRQSYSKWYFDFTRWDTFYFTLNFDCWPCSNPFKLIRHDFHDAVNRALAYKRKRVPMLEVPEWTNAGMPHLNMLVRLPVGLYVVETIKEIVRGCWHDVLNLHHVRSSNPHHQVVSCQRLGERNPAGKPTERDVRQVCDYIFSTNRGSVGINECPPRGYFNRPYCCNWCEAGVTWPDKWYKHKVFVGPYTEYDLCAVSWDDISTDQDIEPDCCLTVADLEDIEFGSTPISYNPLPCASRGVGATGLEGKSRCAVGCAEEGIITNGPTSPLLRHFVGLYNPILPRPPPLPMPAHSLCPLDSSRHG
jgi:hypothetical protein